MTNLKDIEKRFKEKYKNAFKWIAMNNDEIISGVGMQGLGGDIESFYRKEFISLLEGLKEEEEIFTGSVLSEDVIFGNNMAVKKHNAKIDKLIEG